jgi:hypothetical protein
MDTPTFVELLRQTVVIPATKDTISQIETPSGRNPSDDRKRRATWLNALSAEEREHVEYAIAQAAKAATFGIFCVLDGARVIENNPHRGHLELRYINGTTDTLLASSAEDIPLTPLHELL